MGTRAQLAMAEKALADTQIRAPFAGYVSARAATPGEYVATTAKIAYSGTAPLALSSAVSSSSSSSGAMTFPIAIPSAGVAFSGYGLPALIFH